MDEPANSTAPLRPSATPERPERPAGLSALQSELLLEPQGGLRHLRGALPGAAARPDHRGGLAAAGRGTSGWSTATPKSSTDADLAWADLVMTGGMLPQQRRLPGGHRSLPGRRASRSSSAARTRRPARRSMRRPTSWSSARPRASSTASSQAWEAGERTRSLPGGEVQGRRDHEPDSALRPARARATTCTSACSSRAAVRSTANSATSSSCTAACRASKTNRADARRARGAVSTWAIAAMSISSTTTSSATRRRIKKFLPDLEQWQASTAIPSSSRPKRRSTWPTTPSFSA